MTQNSINNTAAAFTDLSTTIDPGASGDSFIQFDINGTGEFRLGVDDDDGDSLKLSQGSALGTNDTYVITSDGEITAPLNPAFLAYLGTTDSNVTGDGTIVTLGSGNALTEIYDQGGDFVTTGTFTAPITGRYRFDVSLRTTAQGTSNFFTVDFTTSNRVYACLIVNPSPIKEPSSDSTSMSLAVLADMDASDTCFVRMRLNGAGGKTAGIQSSNADTSFGGALVC